MTRRGYILIFVLGVTTVVTALGLSYIASNGTVMQQASNRSAAVRAQYVAESGVALAQHFLLRSPTTVAANSHYTGGSGIAIDSSFDTVDIAVTPTGATNHYRIEATSTVRNANGTDSLAKQSVQADVIIPPIPKWKIAQAILSPGSVDVPARVSIAGNLHANGLATSPLLGGSCTGIVSATVTALWLGGGPPSAVLSLQPAIACPPVTSSLYANYKINNTAYAAYAGFSANIISVADTGSITAALNISTTNPGRIVFLPAGDVRIKDNVRFSGMLVVRGNLEVDGPGIELQAVADYPALLVTGDILCKASNMGMTVTGPVLCGGKISDDGKSGCSLAFTGAAIVSGGVSRTGGTSTIRFTWNEAHATFWDFARTANPEPVTTLTWQEN